MTNSKICFEITVFSITLVMMRREHVQALLLAVCLSVAVSSATAQGYSFGQATWYEPVDAGCVAAPGPHTLVSEQQIRHVSILLCPSKPIN